MAPHLHRYSRIVQCHIKPVSSRLITPSQLSQRHLNDERNIPGSTQRTGLPPNEQFPGGRFNVPSTKDFKRPSIRVGGGGISLGPEFEPDLEGLPWEPAEVHPERPPPGYMNIDGFFDEDIQVDSKKYRHSVFVMPQFVVKWNCRSLEDITPEHFALPTIHYPAIRHIFVGVGYTMPCPTPPEWIEYLDKYKITVEICALGTAARMFNMQNTLYQNFACALLYEKDVVRRFHNVVRKVDLDMDDPLDTGDRVPPGGSYYHGRKKWE